MLRGILKGRTRTKARPSLSKTLALFIIITSLTSVLVGTARASYGWNESSKNPLSETTNTGPALAYDSHLGKAFMAWAGTDSAGTVNVISTSDMQTWTNKVVTNYQIIGYGNKQAYPENVLGMTYNNDNQYLYLTIPDATGCGLGCFLDFIDVVKSNDGSTWTKVGSIVGNGTDNSGPKSISITYDSSNKRLVVATNYIGCATNSPSGCSNEQGLYVYKSTDGGTGGSWDSGTQITYNGNQIQTKVEPEISYVNGKYFLVYELDTDGYIHILQSTDLTTWTNKIDLPETTYEKVAFGYNPAEGLYHLMWQGSGLSKDINDETSSDGTNWGNKVYFESTLSGPGLTYFSPRNAELLGWMGTDSCTPPPGGWCGHVNSMPQNTPTNGAQFVSQSSPPSTMSSGQQAYVSVTMKNTGTTAWTPPSINPSNPFRLGAQNPQDNTNWRFNRVELTTSVAPGNSYTFQFTITAPSTPGTYAFQWRTVQEGVQWFGDFTPNVQVSVVPPDFGLSANPTSLSINQTQYKSSTITLASINGFSGTISLSASTNAIINGITYLYWNWPSCSCAQTSVTLASGGTATPSINIFTYSNTPPGTYTVTVTGTSGSITHSAGLSITVLAYASGGGGASLAYGTLITMAIGAKLPVQNLKVGDQMMGYNTSTGQYVVSTVTSIVIRNATNMLVINTRTGNALRVDASLTEVLWTKLPNGTSLWLPAPQEQVGYDLWTQNGWVAITSISYAPAGNHTMWDITATAPYFASGYLDPPHPS